jgi:hypothetical protein
VKFVLINLSGHTEAEGDLPEFAVGSPQVLTWRGRAFVADHTPAHDVRAVFVERWGHALGHFEALPINGPPVVWSSPTALGQRAAAAVDRPPMRRRGEPA